MIQDDYEPILKHLTNITTFIEVDPHDKSLKDLPESLVTFLIDFVLDAMGLFGDELLLPPADCARIHGRYWADLGETESQRRKRFDALSEARTDWSTHAREALCRALADIRQYEFDAARLTLMPPKLFIVFAVSTYTIFYDNETVTMYAPE
ncbi:unnamed protein product [Cylicocyclus nassatus]|uniref:Uncharacterized protein n=1 Tax=Cylicocyclus nassatus TaxID=53992 RepID=A0AA36GWW3_CYLNA|nr:unnamed protein product [Cylicocyclus nassatus]